MHARACMGVCAVYVLCMFMCVCTVYACVVCVCVCMYCVCVVCACVYVCVCAVYALMFGCMSWPQEKQLQMLTARQKGLEGKLSMLQAEHLQGEMESGEWVHE